jgi:hypothetical protein
MAMPATDGDQLGVKLRLFSVELAKEAEFGQNPDFLVDPIFCSHPAGLHSSVACPLAG